MGSGIMQRHHAQIPDEYAGLRNPIPADQKSLENGANLFTLHCASCHGEDGMGDGPAGQTLDPAPAVIAHTSQMMGDDYLFWRISEGSGAFNTAMPGWKAILDEKSRWDLINYVRALGSSGVNPGEQNAHEEEMLAQAVEQKVITQAEANTFMKVHDAIDEFRTGNPEFQYSDGSPTEREAAILGELVQSKVINQAEANAFNEIHERLGNSGLMP